MKQITNLLHQAQVARLLGVSRQRVHQLIRAGKLETETVDGRVMVTRASVEKRAWEMSR